VIVSDGDACFINDEARAPAGRIGAQTFFRIDKGANCFDLDHRIPGICQLGDAPSSGATYPELPDLSELSILPSGGVRCANMSLGTPFAGMAAALAGMSSTAIESNKTANAAKTDQELDLVDICASLFSTGDIGCGRSAVAFVGGQGCNGGPTSQSST
jgi:hypothetical protein